MDKTSFNGRNNLQTKNRFRSSHALFPWRNQFRGNRHITIFVSYGEPVSNKPNTGSDFPSIFTCYLKNRVNPSISVRVENTPNNRSVCLNTGDLYFAYLLVPPFDRAVFCPFFMPNGINTCFQNMNMRVVFLTNVKKMRERKKMA